MGSLFDQKGAQGTPKSVFGGFRSDVENDVKKGRRGETRGSATARPGGPLKEDSNPRDWGPGARDWGTVIRLVTPLRA